MNTMQTNHHSDEPAHVTAGRPLKTALWMAGLIAGFYLLREHWDHVVGNWVYLLLLACPLMHLLHGHGGAGKHGAPPDDSGPRQE